MGSDMGGNGVRHEIMQKDSAPVAFVEGLSVRFRRRMENA